MVDAELPRAGEAIYSPEHRGWGRGGATVLGGGKDKVVGEDGERRSFLLILYKCGAHAVRLLPGMRAPKRSPIAFTVGDGVYVMEAAPPEPLPMRGGRSTSSMRSSTASRRRRRGAGPPSRTGTGAPSRRRPTCSTPARTGPPASPPTRWSATPKSGCPRSGTTRSPSKRQAARGPRPAIGRSRSAAAPSTSRSTISGSASPPTTTTTSAPPTSPRRPRRRAAHGGTAQSPPHKDWPAPVSSYLVPLGAGRLCVAELFVTTRVEVGGRPLDDKKKKAASKTTTRRWGFKAAAAAKEEEDEEETEVTERFAVVTGVEVEASASGKAVRMAKRAVRRYVLSTGTVITPEAKRCNTTCSRRRRRCGRPRKDDDEMLHWVF